MHAINIALQGEISWLSVADAKDIANGFKEHCGLLGILGAIDGTHFSIGKLRLGVDNYYYFKSEGYNCQAIVDSSKCLMDLYVDIPGSMNNSHIKELFGKE